MQKRNKLSWNEYQISFVKKYDEGWGINQIARYLSRSPSTISRLFSRARQSRPGNWNLLSSFAKAEHAWRKYRARMSKARKRLRLKSKRIRRIVLFILRRWHWSPETISDFLKEHGFNALVQLADRTRDSGGGCDQT